MKRWKERGRGGEGRGIERRRGGGEERGDEEES